MVGSGSYQQTCEHFVRPEEVLHLGTTTRLAFFRKTGSLR